MKLVIDISEKAVTINGRRFPIRVEHRPGDRREPNGHPANWVVAYGAGWRFGATKEEVLAEAAAYCVRRYINKLQNTAPERR